MSVTSINERIDSGTGSESATKRSHTRVFIIETSSSADNTATILNNREVGPDVLPRANDTHPDDAAATCSNISIRRLDATEWEATCQYDYTGDTATTTGEEEVNPWYLPPYNISISSFAKQRVVEKGYETGDAQGSPSEPIVIPVDPPDKFDPPPVDDTYITLLKFSYNLETFSISWVSQYRNTINLNPIVVLDLSIASKQALLQNISGTRNAIKNNSGMRYWWQVDVELAISENGFDIELLLAGFHMMDSGSKYEIGIDSTGTIVKRPAASKTIDAVTEPQLLKADGTLVGKGGTPVYKKWQTKYAKDWASLNLPASLD